MGYWLARACGAAVAASLFTFVCVPAASAVTAPEAISLLNQQRVANGLPGDITENPDWSRGCAQHVQYVNLNRQDNNNPHDEDPSRPGYTPEGQQAARASVLGGFFNPRQPYPNGWEDAPFHLAQLLGPGLSVTGYADGCMYTWPGYQRPAPEQTALYTYPGNGATIYYHERTDSELPDSPAGMLGLNEQNLGTHLFVFAFSTHTSSVQITGASLTGPDGSVPVRWVDNFTDGAGYIPPGGIVIPPKPLKPNSDYSASVTGQGNDGEPLTWSWTFHTDNYGATPEPEETTSPATIRACRYARGATRDAKSTWLKARARWRKHRTGANRKKMNAAELRYHRVASREVHICGAVRR
jgi:hypothetical protein